MNRPPATDDPPDIAILGNRAGLPQSAARLPLMSIRTARSSSALAPGHAGDRAILAALVDNRLFFAGEATSPNFFSTAHGAHNSSGRAARELIASYGR